MCFFQMMQNKLDRKRSIKKYNTVLEIVNGVKKNKSSHKDGATH